MQASDFVDPSVTLPALAGLLMLGLAAWFAFLDYASPLHRSFALFLTLRGLAEIAQGFAAVDDLRPLWSALAPYFGIALPFAVLYFIHVYRVHRLGAPARPWILPALLLAAIVLEALYLRDHALFVARDTAGAVVFGPLFLLVGVLYIVYAGIAILLIRQYTRTPPSKRPTSLVLTGVAFMLICLNVGFYYLLVLVLNPPGVPGSGESAGGPPPIPAILAGVLLALSGLLVAPMLWLLSRDARRHPNASRTDRRSLAFLLLPAATGFIAVGAAYASPVLSRSLVLIFDALWAAAFSLLVAYALVRHQLFDIKVKLRWTIRRGTLVGLFVAAYLAGAEVAQNYLTQQLDWAVGSVLAALLFLAITPLSRLTNRLAEVAVPRAKPSAELPHAERLRLYEEQVSIAWADGSLSLKERRMLDHSRGRLRLSPGEAHRIEAAVLGSP